MYRQLKIKIMVSWNVIPCNFLDDTNTSEEPATSIFRFWNIGICLVMRNSNLTTVEDIVTG